MFHVPVQHPCRLHAHRTPQSHLQILVQFGPYTNGGFQSVVTRNKPSDDQPLGRRMETALGTRLGGSQAPAEQLHGPVLGDRAARPDRAAPDTMGSPRC